MIAVLVYAVLVIAALAVIVLALAARRPDSFSYSRSRTIAAPIDRVFPEVVDLHRMNAWNPYALRETSGTTSYSGPEQGPGARFHFDGRKSGTGHIDVVRVDAPGHVEMRLVMTKPMACDNRVDFTLLPQGNATLVTWAMSGRSNLMARIFGMVVDCDKMLAKDFDEGLANLAAIVEQRPSPAVAAE